MNRNHRVRVGLVFSLFFAGLTACSTGDGSSAEEEVGSDAAADAADTGVADVADTALEDASADTPEPDATTEPDVGDVAAELDARSDASDASTPEVSDAASDTAVPDADAETSDVDEDTGPPGSQGCVDGAGLAEGEHTFMLEELGRRFIVRLPAGYSADRPWPLVLALHPNGGNIGYWDNTDGPRNIRGLAQDDAIVIMAEAIDGNWKDYTDLDNAPERLEMELRYFDEVIGQARGELCVREDAIFAMGFSGGGSFSGVLGCRRPDIRAFAAGGAVTYFQEGNCVGEPAAWITIGEGELMGREPFREFWRERGGCASTSTPTDPEPCVLYDACDVDTPVHYCEHPGEHEWPDFGTEALWEFFVDLVE